MPTAQAAVILSTPPHARYLRFELAVDDASIIGATLMALAARTDGQSIVLGIGAPSIVALGVTHMPITDYLRAFPNDLRMGNTDAPAALWCWVRGETRGDVWQWAREMEQLAAPGFRLLQAVDAFTYQSGRDLTGYEDGTENPKGDAAVQAAIVPTGRLQGSGFVAVQQWVHRFSVFDAMDKTTQDNAVGRERVSNDELDDAPESAHVKRTAQESFEPEAFVLRRSMPWLEGQNGGLMFVAFGCDFSAFEAQWRRMLGLDDGITDALFGFSQPLTHDYYWCPPMLAGRLDLSGIGLAGASFEV